MRIVHPCLHLSASTRLHALGREKGILVYVYGRTSATLVLFLVFFFPACNMGYDEF